MCSVHSLYTIDVPLYIQIQAELGWGHHNVIKAYEAILTPTHFALVMEFASGGSLTSYVSERFSKANTTGLFLNEDEARYFFRVRRCWGGWLAAVVYTIPITAIHRGGAVLPLK